MIHFDLGLDLFPLTAAVLASLACGLLGNILILRKLSLMGDAISHSVLPGLVIAFLIASTRSPLAMFIGAAVAGITTVVLVELVKKLGRVEPGAAMGVAFSVLFALGVLLIERAHVRHIDLDADCVLHGQLETLAWYTAPNSLQALLSTETLEAIPHQVIVLVITLALVLTFMITFFKELRIAAFDPALATTQGFNANALHYALMIFVAIATVASFEAVGSILVIAMLICPAATARLLTNSLRAQVFASAVIAALTATIGYLAATSIPALFGKDSVNAAGSITVVAGFALALAIIASPSQGVLAKSIRRRTLAKRVAQDDLLAILYRAQEANEKPPSTLTIKDTLKGRPAAQAINSARKANLIVLSNNKYKLTPSGESQAKAIIRKHRLWEHYLVDQAGLSPDHVHPTAEQLEHIATQPPPTTSTDPHGKSIPPSSTHKG